MCVIQFSSCIYQDYFIMWVLQAVVQCFGMLSCLITHSFVTPTGFPGSYFMSHQFLKQHAPLWRSPVCCSWLFWGWISANTTPDFRGRKNTDALAFLGWKVSLEPLPIAPSEPGVVCSACDHTHGTIVPCYITAAQAVEKPLTNCWQRRIIRLGAVTLKLKT